MKTKKFYYTQEVYNEGIKKLTTDIKDSGIEFSYIVGIARGGCIPAVHLSHSLNLPLQMIHWSTRDGSLATKNDCCSKIAEDLQENKKILLVDDIIDSGKTVAQLIEMWYDQSFFRWMSNKNLKVCTLVYKTNKRAVADFYHLKDTPGWIEFFWES